MFSSFECVRVVESRRELLKQQLSYQLSIVLDKSLMLLNEIALLQRLLAKLGLEDYVSAIQEIQNNVQQIVNKIVDIEVKVSKSLSE